MSLTQEEIDKIMDNLDKSQPQVTFKKGRNNKFTYFLADNILGELEKLKKP